MHDERRDDGSITVADLLLDAVEEPTSVSVVDLMPILGVDVVIVPRGCADAATRSATRLVDLIDPTTRQAPDGTCERCGAPAEALRDQYCAHCGRRITRKEKGDATGDEATGDATVAIEAIHKARTALYVAIAALGNKALRDLVLVGYSMKLSDAISALFDVEEIAKRGAEEDAE